MSMPKGGRLAGWKLFMKDYKLAFSRVALVITTLVLEVAQEFVFPVFLVKSSKDVSYKGWPIVPIILEILYCVLFTIATVSTLRFFEFMKSLGFFIHILKKMVRFYYPKFFSIGRVCR